MGSRFRFACAASSLSLRSLLGKSRAARWVCLSVGVAIHLALTQIREVETVRKAAKPLTTHFVKRQPRLTKPLELKKRPQPKQRVVERRMVSVKAKMQHGRRVTEFEPTRALGRLAQPLSDIGRVAGLAAPQVGPIALSATIQGARETEEKIDMSLELLDIEALDTGKHHAMVIQDPHDKRRVRGFFHIALVYSISQERWPGPDVWRYEEWRAVPYLAEAISRYTDIRADVTEALSLDEQGIFKVPVVFLTTRMGTELSRSEATNFGEYLLAGGFAFFEDNSAHLGASGDVALRQALRDALATQDKLEGRDWAFEKLPHSHDIFHCYFDFDGPPLGRDAYGAGLYGGRPFPWLDGITVDGRLLAMMSNKGYMSIWGHAGRGEWANDVQAGA